MFHVMKAAMHAVLCVNSQYFAVKHLRYRENAGYSPLVATQWATGICTPSSSSATTDAPCVFFYVAINATERRIMAWCILSGHTIAGHEQRMYHSAMSMVAQAGQLSSWPVPDDAGSANPVWAIAIMKICTFGDSNDYAVVGGCLMATTPTRSHPQFVWLFLAVRRSDALDRPHRHQITAPTYDAARRIMARDFVAAFAGRLPAGEVHHV